MEEYKPVSVNANVRYPSQEVYKKLKVISVETNIAMGELLGEMAAYVLEDQNRLNEIVERIKRRWKQMLGSSMQ
jgi:hypothetical protein